MSVGLGNVRQARWEIFALITAPMDGVGIIPRLTGNAAGHSSSRSSQRFRSTSIRWCRTRTTSMVPSPVTR
ncbi:Uncharacterised protein [Mycobacterium tuberculosis]|uniref:Uncharacterized protein n=1 Tax=Mycobacterium tuberculosis TaxID=1773 RepID=A0A0U0QKB7_MYCTX|nr:Uncharacterised protein [Mycobacterium tuberculosis]